MIYDKSLSEYPRLAGETDDSPETQARCSRLRERHIVHPARRVSARVADCRRQLRVAVYAPRRDTQSRGRDGLRRHVGRRRAV